MENVCIFGAGYVGLPTASHWANVHNVKVYDPDESKIDNIHKGDLHVHESGLKDELEKNKENLKFTSNISEALEGCEIIFLAVGTPPKENGKANLDYIRNAARDIGKNINNDCIVVDKSTVPPGTSFLVEDEINKELKKRGVDFKVNVASSPEFLSEGSAMSDLHSPSRIIIGCNGENDCERLKDFFSLLHSEDKIVVMDKTSAEISKYAANAMLATRISFMNSLAMLCDKIGGNVERVMKSMGMDDRIGSKFLYPGFGYGGSCFPKDTRAIANFSSLVDCNLDIVEATIEVNKKVIRWFADKIEEHYGDLNGKNLVVWGVGFKAETNDIRESKSVELSKILMSKGANLIIYDSVKGALENFRNEVNEDKYVISEEQYGMINEEVDGVIIGNEDERFRVPSIEKLSNMRNKVIFDGKNILADEHIKNLTENGFIYKSVGKDCLNYRENPFREELLKVLKEDY